MDISVLEGLVLRSVEHAYKGSEKVVFQAVDGREFTMEHYQDCCESVELEDVCGDIEDLIGTTILSAYKVSNDNLMPLNDYDDSYTWTFFHIRTIKGTVTFRWYGCSNGYYSEDVDFCEYSAGWRQ